MTLKREGQKQKKMKEISSLLQRKRSNVYIEKDG
jgi:hypothetical protein